MGRDRLVGEPERCRGGRRRRCRGDPGTGQGNSGRGVRDVLRLLAGLSTSRRHSRRHVPVAIESASSLLAEGLMRAGQPVHPIHPSMAARYRTRLSPAKAKSDKGDAAMLANILRVDGHLHRQVPDNSPLAKSIGVLARGHARSRRNLDFRASPAVIPPARRAPGRADRVGGPATRVPACGNPCGPGRRTDTAPRRQVGRHHAVPDPDRRGPGTTADGPGAAPAGVLRRTSGSAAMGGRGRDGHAGARRAGHAQRRLRSRRRPRGGNSTPRSPPTRTPRSTGRFPDAVRAGEQAVWGRSNARFIPESLRPVSHCHSSRRRDRRRRAKLRRQTVAHSRPAARRSVGRGSTLYVPGLRLRLVRTLTLGTVSTT
ncbi:hypothetical protein DL991_10300 [Amycolatopsis sp. WAC 01375]|nr:hypothetical protein DL991_10300 [Amycolatopsis sp. WAC 01375]